MVRTMTDNIPLMELSNFTFRIDPEMREWLERRADDQDRSAAYVLRAVLAKGREAIEREERGDANDDAARS